jgi:putative transposase
MPRPPRVDVADVVYHVINRANGRATIFQKDLEYKLFEVLLEDIVLVRGMRILAYCIMPNHWHLVLQPRNDGDLSETMQWLTTTHTRRWHRERKTIGGGHLYQGRYKSFPVETNEYLLQLIRYVERNPVRAKLVPRAEDWKYSSLYRRQQNTDRWLADTILPLPADYLAWVNRSDEDLDRLRKSVNKGTPLGSDDWVLDMVESYGLGATVTEQGRPRKY